MPEVVLASYNIHGGIDGWGRPFDVETPCRALEADVLIVQEAWTPEVGPSSVSRISKATGLEHVFELAMAPCVFLDPPAGAPSSRWGPPLYRRMPRGLQAYRLGVRDGARQQRRLAAIAPTRRGVISVAVLTRLPVTGHRVADLGRLPRDPSRRGVHVVDLDVGGSALTVLGTHLSHLVQGSPLQLAHLRRLLPSRHDTAVLAGDMNLWGPPLSAALPGWRRAVRGRTWPSTRPIAQPDHIMVTSATTVRDGQVMPIKGSDHLPVRARIVL